LPWVSEETGCKKVEKSITDGLNLGVIVSALKANANQPNAVKIDFVQAKSVDAEGAKSVSSVLKSGG
jgi:hypothetical protein